MKFNIYIYVSMSVTYAKKCLNEYHTSFLGEWNEYSKMIH